MVPSPKLDPMGNPEGVSRFAASAAGAGITLVGADLVSHSKAHYVEQLEALRQVTTLG